MTHPHRLLLKWARTLHVYLTLFGFVLLLFFAVTGFMLNHENWFSPAEPRRETREGKMPAAWLGKPEDRDQIVDTLRSDYDIHEDLDTFEIDRDNDAFHVAFASADRSVLAVIQRDDGQLKITRQPAQPGGAKNDGALPAALLGKRENRLRLVEKLRKDFAAQGEVDSFVYERETDSFHVVFKSPGYAAEADIKRPDGDTTMTCETRGVMGVVLDLHRGKTSGLAWSVLIDAVSILFVVVSATGLILWSSLRGRAQHGLLILLLGIIASLSVYFLWVPR